MTLEVGSGISPISPATDRTVFTELSVPALRCLKAMQKSGHYVVADAGRLPFRAGAFERAVCSEVLEHIEDDLSAVREIASVLAEKGSLVVTFPHRRDFFAVDDRFVRHFRRYDLPEMVRLLEQAGLRCLFVVKVLGPLEKLTMGAVVALLTLLPLAGRAPGASGGATRLPAGFVKLFELANRLYAGLARLDARVSPIRLASVLLIAAQKSGPPPAVPDR